MSGKEHYVLTFKEDEPLEESTAKYKAQIALTYYPEKHYADVDAVKLNEKGEGIARWKKMNKVHVRNYKEVEKNHLGYTVTKEQRNIRNVNDVKGNKLYRNAETLNVLNEKIVESIDSRTSEEFRELMEKAK